MGVNEKILEIVKGKGPILPVQVSKEIEDNILMTSARLSELLSNKLIKVSNLKIGGSPLYYVSGQESKLQNFSDNLSGKEKEAYSLLRDNKILRDTIQEPAIRVALRQIKDFAVPLQVKFQERIEIFWKWFLLEKNEAQSLIKELVSKKEIPKPLVNEEPKIPEKKEEAIQTPEPTAAPEQKKEVQKSLSGEKKERKKIDKELFLKQNNSFFEKNKINVIETNEIKKNSEIDFITELETNIGKVRYFCKSKNKKKISDGDLSSALVQAQSKNLPLLFLTKGELSKKAKEMVEKTNNITFKKI